MENIEKPVVSDNRRMGWASDIAAELLRRLGIKYIALNPGSSFRGFHDSLVNYLGNRDPQLLLCMHEDSVVSIAHGYAKATGEPMACFLHSNVGLMHGSMSVFNAWCDRAPILILGATGPVDAAHRVPWIHWIHTAKDQGAMVRQFVKFDDEPRSQKAMVESILRAVKLVRTKPRGPAYVCLDYDLQEGEVAETFELPPVERFAPSDPPTASDAQVEAAADLLLAASDPVFLFGRVRREQADWDRRVRLAELVGAAIVTDVKTGAVFPTAHPLHVDWPSIFLGDRAKAALRSADVIVDFEMQDPGGVLKQAFGDKDAATAKVIQCSLDSYLHNGWSMDHYALAPADLAILGDADDFAARLLTVVEQRLGGKPRWDGKPKGDPTPKPAAPKLADRDPGAEITAMDISLALAEARGDRKITLAKTCLSWASAGYPLVEPMDHLGDEGGAALGSTVGMAIGSGLALKDSGRLVVANIGDGDFLQGCTGLWTAAHYRIPMLLLIYNNRSNLNDEGHQRNVATLRGRSTENRWIGMRMEDPVPSLVDFARAQGVKADGPIKTVAELVPAMRKGLDAVAAGEPYLIDIWVGQDPG